MLHSIGLQKHPPSAIFLFLSPELLSSFLSLHPKKQSTGPIKNQTKKPPTEKGERKTRIMGGSSVNSRNITLKPIKFLCSYGGRILPRYPDGKLRYQGGETRVLSADSSVSFAELLVKMGEMCGSPVSLRCQLPTEDLDALVSITSDEDLANLIEEYDHAASAAAAPPSIKIRAFLSAPKNVKKVSPPPSSASFCGSDASPTKSPFYMSSAGGGVPPRYPSLASRRYIQRSSRPPAYPIVRQKAAGKIPHQFAYQYYNGHGNGCGLVHLVHNGNHWQ